MTIPQVKSSRVFVGMGINEHPRDESKTDMDLQAKKIAALQKEYRDTGKITPIKSGENIA